MKSAIVVALLLTLAVAITPTKGDEIVKQLQGQTLDGEIFLIFFYDPTCCHEPHTTMNDDVKKDIEDKILSTPNGKKYIFYEVDTSDMDMKKLNKLVSVDEYQTKHGPTVFIGAEGEGFWAHGEDSADKILAKVAQFDRIKAESIEKIQKRDTLIN